MCKLNRKAMLLEALRVVGACVMHPAAAMRNVPLWASICTVLAQARPHDFTSQHEEKYPTEKACVPTELYVSTFGGGGGLSFCLVQLSFCYGIHRLVQSLYMHM